jgi:pimeloyl-ACP methyl ester carboxylesterase
MAASIRGARLVNIPGAGHSSCLETPDAVTAAMQELLQSAKSVAAH